MKQLTAGGSVALIGVVQCGASKQCHPKLLAVRILLTLLLEAEAVLKPVHPDWSIASWSVRFCLETEDVIAVLSGMSTLEQVLENTKTSDEAQPLTEAEHVNLFNGLDKQTVIASDGTDLTELVEKAVAWLTENSF